MFDRAVCALNHGYLEQLAAPFYWGRFFARGPEGGHRMTDKIEACATVLYDAAMERAQDDPDLARADFEVVL